MKVHILYLHQLTHHQLSVTHKCERTPATLLLGDSFLARLDAAKLGKSKKCVLNKAKGGSKISDVLLNIDEFCCDDNNLKYTVGTNDIRYCRNGISHLKGELFGLLRKIKQQFPRAKLFLQSLIPLPITYSNRRYVVRNVCDFNRIIYHVWGVFQHFPIFCQFQKVGGVTKSRPIDPFFYVIYLFSNIRFGQKGVQISYFLPSTLLFFTLFHLNFFDDLFFCSTPPFFLALKIFLPS